MEPQYSFVCHCGKSFLRREHLHRHKANHSEPTHTCDVCQRSFTRSDLLRRHAARHETEAPRKVRIRRACHACHANKTKCDGATPCQLCSRRGLQCIYDEAATQNNETATTPEPVSGDTAQASSLPVVVTNRPQGRSTRNPNSPDLSEPDEQSATCRPNPRNVVLQDSERIVAAVEFLRASHSSSQQEVDNWSYTCLEAYQDRFSISWPIVHCPTIDLTGDPLPISASLLMIGSWLTTTESVAEATLKLHKVLVDVFFKDLCEPRSPLTGDVPWEAEKYQAILLNIIFAFYIKDKQILTRAKMLFGLFLDTLRQVGFFSAKVASYQEQTHFPGTFLPFVLNHRERRIRLIVSLLKLDMYLSFVDGCCPRLQIEEFDMHLPSIFSLWNTYGLREFYQRQPRQPSPRTLLSVVDFHQRPQMLISSAWQVEDIHLGLCGMYRSVWRYNRLRASNNETEPGLKELLTNQLCFWKTQLDRLSNVVDKEQALETGSNPFLQSYLGAETTVSPATLARIASLIEDVAMTYSILALLIFCPASMLNLFVKHPVGTVLIPSATPTNESHDSLREWAHSPDGKITACICISTLQAHEKLIPKGHHRARAAGSLADMALSNSAIAMSAWFQGSKAPCNCGAPLSDTDPFDVRNWIPGAPLDSGDHGLFCSCKAEMLMARYADALAAFQS